MKEIQIDNDDLRSTFNSKELENEIRILEMNIVRNIERKKIWFNQTDYISIIVQRFNMQDLKVTTTPSAQHFKLSITQRANNDAERKIGKA